MTSLTEAHDRLAKAVARLERATAQGQPVADDAEAEIAALRERCDALEGCTGEASRRLDAAIKRLRTLLEA